MAERHANDAVQAQLEINKTEAQHASVFVSGWRPAIGWVCCLGMAGNFLIIPFVNMALELLETGVVVPMIELDIMMPVLMGMLGLGAMRTVEKVKKVDRKS
jgi:CheY-like chemotaxis protein